MHLYIQFRVLNLTKFFEISTCYVSRIFFSFVHFFEYQLLISVSNRVYARFSACFTFVPFSLTLLVTKYIVPFGCSIICTRGKGRPIPCICCFSSLVLIDCFPYYHLIWFRLDEQLLPHHLKKNPTVSWKKQRHLSRSYQHRKNIVTGIPSISVPATKVQNSTHRIVSKESRVQQLQPGGM